MAQQETGYTVAGPWVRRWLWVVVGLVTTVGVVLYLFPRRTDDLFAWTIKSPLTAAFLGASYWAAIPFTLLSLFRRYWADMRLAFHGVGVFSALTLVATLLHLDKFRTGSVPGIVWIVVYVVAPFAIFGIVIWMGRAPGGDPPRSVPLAGWLRGLLLVIALLLLPLGVALFIAPGWADAAWPWALTPLTGRAVAAWLCGIGVIVLHIVWENDWVRTAPAMPSLVALGILHLLAVARFSDEPDWGGPAAWVYLGFLAAFTLIGLYGIITCYRLGLHFTPGGMAERPLHPQPPA